jgi:hypothetical protein
LTSALMHFQQPARVPDALVGGHVEADALDVGGRVWGAGLVEPDDAAPLLESLRGGITDQPAAAGNRDDFSPVYPESCDANLAPRNDTRPIHARGCKPRAPIPTGEVVGFVRSVLSVKL